MSFSTIKPKQSLGQNFLIDDNIAKKIIRELHLKSDDVILEIGAGNGALTSHFLGCVKHIIAVEIDKRIIEELRNRFSPSDVTILHGDFLQTELIEWYRRYTEPLRIVGNIPYHLTSSILFKIYHERSFVKDLTIMVQREVAQRIVAKPGGKEYGILSVLTQFYGKPRVLFTISPNCFYPKPKVTSAVIQIGIHEQIPNNVNEQILQTVVKTTFGKRRKTLRNSLQYLPYDKALLKEFIREKKVPVDKRPEQLSVEQFVHLTQHIEQLIS